jgi:hypothetical protein
MDIDEMSSKPADIHVVLPHFCNPLSNLTRRRIECNQFADSHFAFYIKPSHE